jgi:hypothetical protein
VLKVLSFLGGNLNSDILLNVIKKGDLQSDAQGI